MTKLLTILLFLFLSSDSFAQTIAVKAGLQTSTHLWNGVVDGAELKPGFHVGATAAFPIRKDFSFETGLLLMTKGHKSTDDFFGPELKVNISTLYLDIPLTAKFTSEVGNMKAYFQVGPYLSMGFVGKARLETTQLGQTTTEEVDVEWGSDVDGAFNRVGLGLFSGAGIEFNRIQAGLFFGLGLNDVSKNRHHRVIGISLGYVLSEGK